jgi:hypothetical protein
MDSSTKTVYLMRGLPCCGKSYTARQLAGGSDLVLETDEYFYRHVGTDPTKYDFSEQSMTQAREWNFARFVAAVSEAVPLIIVDRGNSLSRESQRYARHAVLHGYQVELKEPQWELWQEIRVLLKYRPESNAILYRLADQLAKQSRANHRVPASLIRRGMNQWQLDLTVEDILNHGSTQAATHSSRNSPPLGTS